MQRPENTLELEQNGPQPCNAAEFVELLVWPLCQGVEQPRLSTTTHSRAPASFSFYVNIIPSQPHMQILPSERLDLVAESIPFPN
jgi:hypothetical protein